MAVFNQDVVDALKTLRSYTGLTGVSPFAAAFRTLDQAGLFQYVDASGWPELPDGVLGQQIRHRRILAGTRIGGACPYVIVAETDQWVIYQAWASTGRPLDENAMAKDEFEKTFERREI